MSHRIIVKDLLEDIRNDDPRVEWPIKGPKSEGGGVENFELESKEALLVTDVESKRGTLSIKVKAPDSLVLKRYMEMLKGSARRMFEVRFGKILDLVEIEVQPEALSALAQFYDSPMRSFLFKKFQLAPTMEEYKHILGIPLIDRSPYLY
ncbi:hypothetical protein CR513_55109, partial [Mucuna pruriens]